MVSDLNLFIEEIKKNVDKDVNQGLKQTRGSYGYLKNILGEIDIHFRDSLYRHNLAYMDIYRNSNSNNVELYIKDQIYIPPSCFKSKNIHFKFNIPKKNT